MFSFKYWGLKIYEKEAPIQVFSCEYWEIFKNNIFYETPAVVAFDYLISNFNYF